jgi:hypothetical protein
MLAAAYFATGKAFAMACVIGMDLIVVILMEKI